MKKGIDHGIYRLNAASKQDGKEYTDSLTLDYLVKVLLDHDWAALKEDVKYQRKYPALMTLDENLAVLYSTRYMQTLDSEISFEYAADTILFLTGNS